MVLETQRTFLGVRPAHAVLFIVALVVTACLIAVGVISLVRAENGVDVAIGVLTLVFAVFLCVAMPLTWAALHQSISLSNMKSDFISNVSHELRTPLTAIHMYVDTLRLGRAGSEEERRHCLEVVSQEAARLTRLIDRLLEYSRMTVGRRLYERVPVQPRDVIDDALAGFELLLLHEEADLAVDVPATLPTMQGDRDALVQAVLNLLANALKYSTPPRRIRLEARVEGKHLLVSVEDNGMGIPLQLHRRIFHRFYRREELREEQRREGLGLGLAMTHYIVAAHRGRIAVKSAPGEGSRFTMELPVQQQESA